MVDGGSLGRLAGGDGEDVREAADTNREGTAKAVPSLGGVVPYGIGAPGRLLAELNA